jgi:hypothetical protein
MDARYDALTKVGGPAFDTANVITLLVWLAALAIAGGLVLTVAGRLKLGEAAPPTAGGRFGALPGD